MARHRLRAASLVAAGVLAGAGCSVASGPTATEPTAEPQPTPPVPSEAIEGADADDTMPEAASLFVRPEVDVDDDLLAELAALDGVAEVVAPRRDDLALLGSYGPDGAPIDVFADGFRVLVTATVADDPLAVTFSAGEVLLTDIGAALRDLAPGSSIDLDGHDLVVAGRTEDVGSAEFVVHPSDAPRLGLQERERLFVGLDADADPEAVATDVGELLGPQAFVRVRHPRDDDGRPFVLSLAATKARFGEFAFADRDGSRDIRQDPAFIEEHIVTASVPLLGTVQCHERIIDDLVSALTTIAEAGLADEIHPDQYAGCWYPRRTQPGGNLSKHAWGIALDINVDLALPGGGEIPHAGVIDAFVQAGFRWGGDFPTPDNHHFEWVGRPSSDTGA